MLKYMDTPEYIINKIEEKKNKYSLCIPIYNEGERILEELKKGNDTGIYKCVDIILLDGGSTDGTTERKILKENNVNTLIEMKDKGIYRQSQALMAGFDYSIKQGYLGVITIDGNNKDRIERVTDFVEKLKQGYDYIQGSRFIKGGKHENTPFMRNLAIRLIHAPIISLTCGKKYTDTTNLFRGYSFNYLTHDKVQPFRKKFVAYELSTYLSSRADQLKLKTCEIPVERCYPSNGKYSTKVGKIKGNLKLMKALLANLFGKYNIKD